jgi:hypothetical protein
MRKGCAAGETKAGDSGDKNFMWQGTGQGTGSNAYISTSTTIPAIQRELKPEEKLLWNGQPQGGIKLRASDALMIPFSLMWGGFAIFWEVGVITTKAPFFFKLWGIPFVLVGLYMIFGRFIVDAKSREQTSYAVTSQRILIVCELLGRKVKSLNLRNVPEVTLAEKSDGSGTITFGSVSPAQAWNNSSWPGANQSQVPSFEMINNARQVYNIIQEAQQRAQ